MILGKTAYMYEWTGGSADVARLTDESLVTDGVWMKMGMPPGLA